MGVWNCPFGKHYLFHFIKGMHFRLFHHGITSVSFFFLEFLNAFLFLFERREISFYSISNTVKLYVQVLIMQFVLYQWILEVSHHRTPAMLRPGFHWFNFRPVVHQS